VTTRSSDPVKYPFVVHHDLSMDPRYRELQTEGAFKATLDYGEPVWIATSYDDVKLVYGDKRFVKELGHGHDLPRMIPQHIADPSMIAHMDPPRHTRVRRLVLGSFSASKARSMRGWMQALVDETLDEMVASGGPTDWVNGFAWPLPLRVASGILGVPRDEAPMFKGWIDELLDNATPAERKAESLGKLLAYIRARIAERRDEPRDDLLSEMVRARDEDDQLNEDELVSLSLALFLAGFETTAAQIANTMYVLLSRRELWEELKGDPDLLDSALEELWRWIPAFRHGWPMIQWASEDIELSNGVVIPAGEPVLPEHQIANRDESKFVNGDQIDFHRVDPDPHLSLAWGAHRCLGAHIAHLELETTLRTLLDRLPDLELVTPVDDVKWVDGDPAAQPDRAARALVTRGVLRA
jgi:cytochrome P450 RapN